jgi:uncharacterized membrane protein
MRSRRRYQIIRFSFPSKGVTVQRRFLTGLFVIVVLAALSLGAIASAQTSQPTGAACSPATPCADRSAAVSPLARVEFRTASAAVHAVESQPAASGFGLAWAVMILLVVALLYAFIAALLVAFDRAAPALPAGASVAIPALAVIGLGVAIYLTFIETTNAKAVCGPVGDCNTVQASPFAKLFGVVPVGLLGAVGYIGILAAWFLGRRGRGRLAQLMPVVIFGMALFGVLFSIYLTYIELFVIHAVCIWCLTSAVIMALVLALSVGEAMDAINGEQPM